MSGVEQQTVDSESALKVEQLLEQLLQERQQMLILFCQVAGLEPYSCEQPLQDLVRSFCDVMVDYIALGHFEVYQRIGDVQSDGGALANLTAELYPRIEVATQKAVVFSDRYASGDACEHKDDFAMDLSELGEDLAARIELEDRLIQQAVATTSAR